MDANARLDYFRSEFEGKVSKAKAELAAQLAASNERVRQLEENYGKLLREFKDLEMSVAG